MPGKVFEKYRHDPSIFHPVYLLPIGLYIGGKSYILTQELRMKEYGGEKTEAIEWIFTEAEEKDIHSSRPEVEQEDFPVGQVIREVQVVNEKKILSRKGKAVYRIDLTKEIRFIFDRGYLHFRKPVYFSPFMNIEDDSREAREWDRMDRLPEEWEESYEVETEVETLSFTE